jgi:kumamolisin
MFRSPQRSSREEFGTRFGAHPADIDRVIAFLHSRGLTQIEADDAARTVTVSGTVGKVSDAFAIRLHQYEITTAGSPADTYRGRDGYVHIPSEFADVIVGVFGTALYFLDLRVLMPGFGCCVTGGSRFGVAA